VSDKFLNNNISDIYIVNNCIIYFMSVVQFVFLLRNVCQIYPRDEKNRVNYSMTMLIKVNVSCKRSSL
jgi:hypothetical protein